MMRATLYPRFHAAPGCAGLRRAPGQPVSRITGKHRCLAPVAAAASTDSSASAEASAVAEASAASITISSGAAKVPPASSSTRKETAGSRAGKGSDQKPVRVSGNTRPGRLAAYLSQALRDEGLQRAVMEMVSPESIKVAVDALHISTQELSRTAGIQLVFQPVRVPDKTAADGAPIYRLHVGSSTEAPDAGGPPPADDPATSSSRAAEQATAPAAPAATAAPSPAKRPINAMNISAKGDPDALVRSLLTILKKHNTAQLTAVGAAAVAVAVEVLTAARPEVAAVLGKDIEVGAHRAFQPDPKGSSSKMEVITFQVVLTDLHPEQIVRLLAARRQQQANQPQQDASQQQERHEQQKGQQEQEGEGAAPLPPPPPQQQQQQQWAPRFILQTWRPGDAPTDQQQQTGQEQAASGQPPNSSTLRQRTPRFILQTWRPDGSSDAAAAPPPAAPPAAAVVEGADEAAT